MCPIESHNTKPSTAFATEMGRIGLVVAFILLCSNVSADSQLGTFSATFDLTVSDHEINEGDVVHLDIVNVQHANAVTGEAYKLESDITPVTWNFGAAQPYPYEGFGLYNLTRRFRKSLDEAAVIKATYLGTTKQVSLKVNNVAPTVHSVSVTKVPLKNEPVVFQAVAKDPGFFDTLIYEWDFGDGSTATGQGVSHIYASEGSYQVTLTVKDEKETRGGTFSVKVGATPFTPGMLDVDGDFTIADAPIDSVILVGSTSDPSNPTAGGLCQLRLEMRSKERDFHLTLTALLNPGLAPGHYNIGKTTEWDGQHKNEASAIGTFFGDWAAPEAEEDRYIRGTRVGGPFWSEGGRVSITKFDDENLALNFEVALIERIPDSYSPRKVRVVGGLNIVMGSPDTLTDSAGIGQFIPGSDGSQILYRCGGEEPTEFDIVSSLPGPNASNAEYLEHGIEVMFTQAVDPDSLLDNAYVGVQISDNTIKTIPGGWVVSLKNRKMIQFIPQATLVSGAVHCVRLDTGAEGIKSLSGNALGNPGNSFSEAMTPACSAPFIDEPGAEMRAFAFSTQVRLESAWADFYQGSLAGGIVPLVPEKMTVARVYSYWNPELANLHESAQVTEFKANVYLTRERTSFFPMQTAIIKRQDQYSALERTRTRNTVNFVARAPTVGSAASDAPVFPVIQPLDNSGEPIGAGIPGAVGQLKIWENHDLSNFYVQTLVVQGTCPADVSDEECVPYSPVQPLFTPDFTEELEEELEEASKFTIANMPVVNISTIGTGAELNTQPQLCSEGFEDGICFDAQNGFHMVSYLPGELDDLASRLTSLVENRDIAEPVHITVALVGPGILPDPDNKPIVMYNAAYPLSPLIIAQVDRIKAGEMAFYLVASVLAENGCNHYHEESNCNRERGADGVPGVIQGVKFKNPVSFEYLNKHHAEGNEESEHLDLFLRRNVSHENSITESFISAYQFQRLFAPLSNRKRLWDEDHAP